MSLLNTLAARHPMKMTRGQISALSGRSLRSSAFSGAMTEITRNGWVVAQGGLFELSGYAQEQLDLNFGQAINSGDVIAKWMQVLPAYEESLFKVLVAVYPDDISRDVLSERTGRSIKSSAFSGAISTLVKNGLATVSGGSYVRASDDLFV